jgi:hypothetical protein
MKLFSTSVIFLLLLFANLYPAQAQQRIVIGLIISDENAQPVPLAGIRNVITLKKYLSNRQGIFRIPVSTSDSFVFTSIGFDPFILSGNDLLSTDADTVLLLMHAGSYRLKDVTIVYSNRKRDSIARVVAQVLKTDSLMNNNRRILNRPRGREGSDAGMGYTGFITELYYQFSKEGKDMVRFEEFVKYYREVQQADVRYNKTIIQHITGLPENKLDDFILFCKLPRPFIIESDDYTLIKAIKDCESRFRVEKNYPR